MVKTTIKNNKTLQPPSRKLCPLTERKTITTPSKIAITCYGIVVGGSKNRFKITASVVTTTLDCKRNVYSAATNSSSKQNHSAVEKAAATAAVAAEDKIVYMEYKNINKHRFAILKHETEMAVAETENSET